MTDGTTDDETDDDSRTVTETWEELADHAGQSYLTADDAFEFLIDLGPLATEQWVADQHGDTFTVEDITVQEDGAYALSVALEDAQRSGGDIRGIARTWPHDMLVTAKDVSSIIVEAMGEEPADASMLGSGSTADVRHDGNIEIIGDRLREEGALPVTE